MEVIKKGAEANLILADFSEVFYPSEREKILIKHRISKGYRTKKLDKKLRDFRTSLEAKLLSDAKRAGVPTPTVYRVDLENMRLFMQYVEGEAVKEILEDLDSEHREELCRTIGKQIGQLHDSDIIHGDLTTSNMIRSDEGKIYFIDFGLGEYNSSVEAKGTDIHLLHRTLESTHFEVADESYHALLEGYKEEYPETAGEVIQRIEEIETRGRYVEKEERK